MMLKIGEFAHLGGVSIRLLRYYNNLSQTYAAIMGWIEANGYKITAPGREIYLEGGGAQDDESFVTETQFPVEKATA